MNGREKKAKAAKDPIQNPQYIYQYKIQNIVPNTFSNTESIAQEESLHNQLKKINHYPSTVEGGGGGGFINQFPTLDSRSAKCCNFQYKMRLRSAKSNLGERAGAR